MDYDAIIRNTTSKANFNRLLDEAAASGNFENFIRKSPEFQRACMAECNRRYEEELTARKNVLRPLRDALMKRLPKFGFNNQDFEEHGQFRIRLNEFVELSLIRNECGMVETLWIQHNPYEMLHHTMNNFCGDSSDSCEIVDQIAIYILRIHATLMMSVHDVYEVFKLISPKIAKFYRDHHKISGHDIFVKSNENFFDSYTLPADLVIHKKMEIRLTQCMEKLSVNFSFNWIRLII